MCYEEAKEGSLLKPVSVVRSLPRRSLAQLWEEAIGSRASGGAGWGGVRNQAVHCGKINVLYGLTAAS